MRKPSYNGRVSIQLQYTIPAVPTTHHFVVVDESGCCLGCRLHRTKRTVDVNTETNTPVV